MQKFNLYDGSESPALAWYPLGKQDNTKKQIIQQQLVIWLENCSN